MKTNLKIIEKKAVCLCYRCDTFVLENSKAMEKHSKDHGHMENHWSEGYVPLNEILALKKELQELLNDTKFSVWLKKQEKKLKVGKSFSQALLREILGDAV